MRLLVLLGTLTPVVCLQSHYEERTIWSPKQNRNPSDTLWALIPLSTRSWRLEILYYSPDCVIEDI